MDKLDGHPDFMGEFVPDNAGDAQSEVDRLKAENERLVGEIIKWWNEHQYDTTGDYGEWNLYDEPPPFVVLALKSSPNT